MNELITPPNHVHFLAKKLFGEAGDKALCCLE